MWTPDQVSRGNATYLSLKTPEQLYTLCTLTFVPLTPFPTDLWVPWHAQGRYIYLATPNEAEVFCNQVGPEPNSMQILHKIQLLWGAPI